MNRATGIIVGILTVLVAWFAWQAQRNASELRTRLLVSDARVELLTNDADAALPLALAAAQNDFGDPTVQAMLNDVVSAASRHVLRGHTTAVAGVAFSPDGQMALSGAADRMLRLWDVATGDTLRIFRGHASVVDGVAFSPDGQYILSGSWDETVHLRETETCTTAHIFSGARSMLSMSHLVPMGSKPFLAHVMTLHGCGMWPRGMVRKISPRRGNGSVQTVTLKHSPTRNANAIDCRCGTHRSARSNLEEWRNRRAAGRAEQRVRDMVP
jgi:WD40 repeat protein